MTLGNNKEGSNIGQDGNIILRYSIVEGPGKWKWSMKTTSTKLTVRGIEGYKLSIPPYDLSKLLDLIT